MADILKPGEVCSIDQALRLGLYDMEKNTYTSNIDLKIDLSDTRTFNPSEYMDYSKKKAFCRQYENETVSFPLCPLVGGVPYTQVPGDPSRCMPAKCPPGFVQNPSDITECKKPTDYMYANKSKECGEKQYDWYTIPNYHLGNRYKKLGDACFRPCDGDNVPLVQKDPTDNEEWNIELGDSVLPGQKCTTKSSYMNGKYSSDTNYCPIAVIKRLSTTPSVLQKELQEQINDMALNISNRSSVKQRINTKLGRDASMVATSCHLRLDNVKSGTKQFQIACEKMATADEIQQTYEICKNLKYHPNKITSAWRTELQNDDEDIRVKRAVLEQACHEVFCKKPENAMEIGEQALCFKPPGFVDTNAYNMKHSADAVQTPGTTAVQECQRDPITNLCITRSASTANVSTIRAPGTKFASDFLKNSESIFVAVTTAIVGFLVFYFLVWRKGMHVVNAILGKCSSA